MSEYKFTKKWFEEDKAFEILKSNLKGKQLDILEIGSFEGASAVWFLENLIGYSSTLTCVDPWTTYSQTEKSFQSYGEKNTEWDFADKKQTFEHNIQLTGKKDQVTIIQGFSHEILPKLISQGKKYDLIFIDGNHVSSFVLTDAVFSWYLLKKDGYLLFDDYEWGLAKTKASLKPKLGIDSFIECFGDYLSNIHTANRNLILKNID